MEKRNVFIIGDSYSTYKGYNPEGYHFYYSDGRVDAPVVKGVDKTWWRIAQRDADLNIVVNDSYSGSTVCNTVRENFPLSSSFINRIDKYIAENAFEGVDTLIIFGGTNDSWINAPVGEPVYENQTAEQLLCVLPAFCYLISRAKSAVSDVVAVINTNLKAEITDGFVAACEKLGARYVLLEDIDKVNGHPTELGMEQIAAQIVSAL